MYAALSWFIASRCSGQLAKLETAPASGSSQSLLLRLYLRGSVAGEAPDKGMPVIDGQSTNARVLLRPSSHPKIACSSYSRHLAVDMTCY